MHKIVASFINIFAVELIDVRSPTVTEKELGITALSNCHSKESLKAAPWEEKRQSHSATAACASEVLSDVFGLQ